MENWNSLLTSLAEKAMETGQDVYGFVLEQSPELVKEVIFWGVFENGISAALELLWIAIILIGYYLFYKVCKKDSSIYWDEDAGGPQPWIPLFVLVLLPVFVLFSSIDDFTSYSKEAAKAYFTPRIYMIEYTSDLINKNK